MKINLTTEIKQRDGIKPIVNVENNLSLTLKDVCINALLALIEKDDEKTKYSDYELYKRIRDVKEVDLKTEEIVRIKKKIGAFNPPLILGQAFDLLENKKVN